MRKKKILFIICIVLIVIVSVSHDCVRISEDGGILLDVQYLSENTKANVAYPLSNYKVSLDMLDTDFMKHVVIDSALLNESVRKSLLKRLEGERRVIVLGDISKERLYEYFDLCALYPETYAKEETSSTIELSMSETEKSTAFTKIGVMVYQQEGDIIVCDIFTEIYKEELLILETLEHCLRYDFCVINKDMKPENNRYNHAWKEVGYHGAVYNHTRGIVTTVLSLAKESSGPNYQGEYIYYVPYVAEIEMKQGYTVHKGSLRIGTKPGSKIIDYGPISTTPETSLSTHFAWRPERDAFVQVKTQLEKVGGGIGFETLFMEYRPVTVFYADDYVKKLRCEAYLEAYQTDPLFLVYGQFNFDTCKGTTYIDDFSIRNDRLDTLAGK